MLIEINLAPGAAGKLRSRRMRAFSAPSMPQLSSDIRVIGGVGLALIMAAGVLYGFSRMGARVTSLEGQIQQEVTDSIRYAGTIELISSIQARQDTIRQKIAVIQSVDTRRFVWPHLLDEIGRALPAYTWLTEIRSTAGGDTLQVGPHVVIEGNAGSTQALTRFMKNLEASAFIRDVTLITSEQEDVEGRMIQRFGLEARYRTPAATEIETVPILVIE